MQSYYNSTFDLPDNGNNTIEGSATLKNLFDVCEAELQAIKEEFRKCICFLSGMERLIMKTTA